MYRLIFVFVAMVFFVGCGSKRDGRSFNLNHRPTELLSCESGALVLTELDGKQVGNATLHMQEDYAELDFMLSSIGEKAQYVHLMILPDDPANLMNTNFVAYNYDDYTGMTGDVYGDMFLVEEGYWAMVEGFQELMEEKIDDGFVLTGFTLGNNSVLFLFEEILNPANTDEQVLGVLFYVSTMVNEEQFGDEVSTFFPCSYNPLPWE